MNDIKGQVKKKNKQSLRDILSQIAKVDDRKLTNQEDNLDEEDIQQK